MDSLFLSVILALSVSQASSPESEKNYNCVRFWTRYTRQNDSLFNYIY